MSATAFLERAQDKKGDNPFCRNVALLCLSEKTELMLSAVPVLVDKIEHLLTVARQFGAEVLVVI